MCLYLFPLALRLSPLVPGSPVICVDLCLDVLLRKAAGVCLGKEERRQVLHISTALRIDVNGCRRLPVSAHARSVGHQAKPYRHETDRLIERDIDRWIDGSVSVSCMLSVQLLCVRQI